MTVEVIVRSLVESGRWCVAHCPFEKLADIRDALDESRAWPGIREPRPGSFYLGRIPFLHFHIDKTGRRWADARDGAEWGAEIEIPIAASRSKRSAKKEHS